MTTSHRRFFNHDGPLAAFEQIVKLEARSQSSVARMGSEDPVSTHFRPSFDDNGLQWGSGLVHTLPAAARHAHLPSGLRIPMGGLPVSGAVYSLPVQWNGTLMIAVLSKCLAPLSTVI